MRRVLLAAAVMGSVACGDGTTVGPTPRPTQAACSAAGLSADLPAQDVPTSVAEMRTSIAAAAVECDYARLEELATRDGSSFTYSFGAGGSSAVYWRGREAAGEKVLWYLVKVLAAPYGTTQPEGAEIYAWPRVSTVEKPTGEDWRSLDGIYPSEQIDRMKQDALEQDVGYLAYRAGITATGDWLYFVAGD